MIRRRDGWSIVLAGFWNRSLFLPEWVGPRLFPEPGLEVEIALLPALPVIYRDQQVSMEISWGRLVFRPLNLADDAVLLRVEGMARSMLQALPETPVQAVGINFGYREQIPPGHVLAMFNDVDDGELGQQGWSISERKMTRRLTRGGDSLALTMTYNDESVDFDFNFHTDIQTNAIAQQAVEARRSLRLRDAAIDLLRQTYHLELEEDNDGDGN
jgi:hypothetical protein